MKIIKFTANNIKRLGAVEITPQGNVVKITGKNAAGKSSVLDAIFWALGGKGVMPSKPIRAGAESAQVTLDLGDMMVTRRLAEIEEQKTKALEEAQFPLEGLSLEDGYVTYNSIPLEQLSSAEKLRVALAITMKANPEIRVIRITDGSLLDVDSLAEVTKLATKHDFQVWVEIVDETGEVGIVMEEGEVAKVNQDNVTTARS